MDSFVQYAAALFSREAEEFAFRAYITESVRLYGQSKTIGQKWVDIVRPRKVVEPAPERIIEKIVEQGGLIIE